MNSMRKMVFFICLPQNYQFEMSRVRLVKWLTQRNKDYISSVPTSKKVAIKEQKIPTVFPIQTALFLQVVIFQ